MGARWSFFGHHVPDEIADRLADHMVLRDERDGRHVTRMRTEDEVPVPRTCLCSHSESLHYRDRKGRPTCGNAACGCIRFRLKEQDQ